MFVSLHEGSGLDQEQGVMIIGAARPQEQADIHETIGAPETEPIDIKSFADFVIGNEIDDMRQCAWAHHCLFIDANDIDRPAGCRAGRIDIFRRQRERATNRGLKTDGEATVVMGSDGTVREPADLSIP